MIDYQDITRVKNITNKVTGKAYLDKDKKFVLHYPDKLKNSVLDASTDDIIVLYQRIGRKRYLTHLVKPIDGEIIKKEGKDNYRYGRRVEVIAHTGDDHKILYEKSLLTELNFRNRGWGRAELLTDIVGKDSVEKYQKNIWELFKPFFSTDV